MNVFIMKIKLFLLATLIFSVLSAYGQNTPEQNLLTQANDMGEKFIAKDYAGFLKYAHPATVKTMGGEKKMIADTAKSFREFEMEGVAFLDLKFGIPTKILNVENELQCTLPEMIEMQVKGGKLTTTTTLIAISEDNGKNWYFLDTGSNDLMTMKLLLPKLSDDLVIPPPYESIFEEDVKKE